MKALRGLVTVLLLTVSAAAAVEYGPGVHDLAGVLDDDAETLLSARCAELSERGLELAVVIVREPASGENAEAWLKQWAATAETKPSRGRAVVHIALADGSASCAAEGAVATLWRPSARDRLIADALKPALAQGNLGTLLDGLRDAADQLSATSGPAPKLPPPPLPPAAAQPSRPWLGPLPLVAGPVLLCLLAAWLRLGRRHAALVLPWLLALYSGLYLLLRFRPVWFMALGFTAVAPVIYLALTPPAPRPVRLRPSHGGFGCRGFGALGMDRLRGPAAW